MMLLGQTPVLKFLDQCPYKVLGTLNQELLIKKKIEPTAVRYRTVDLLSKFARLV